MSDLHRIYPNVFNDRETAALRTAFDLAWDRLTVGMKAANTDFIKQRRLAYALMVIASDGETDPDAMADRALVRYAKGLF